MFKELRALQAVQVLQELKVQLVQQAARDLLEARDLKVFKEL